MRVNKNSILIVCIVPLLFGCGQSDKGKTLQEIKEETLKTQQSSSKGSMSNMGGSDPHAVMDLSMGMGSVMPIEREKTAVDNVLTWTAPDSFKEEAASGLRLATFKEAGKTEAIDVSIVTLSQIAGNVPANLARWAGQLGLSLDNAQMDQFIRSSEAIETKSRAKGWIFDFTALQQGADTQMTKSMIACIVEMEGSVVFVKMTGLIDDVLRNKQAFKQLAESIETKSRDFLQLAE